MSEQMLMNVEEVAKELGILYHMCDITEPEERIHKALNDKMEAVLWRECCTQYRTGYEMLPVGKIYKAKQPI